MIVIVLLICTVIVIFCIEQKVFLPKTDEQCLINMQHEIKYSLEMDKYINCFSPYEVKDTDDNMKRYIWTKTWKNKPDTIFVVVNIAKSYWAENISYEMGNQDLWNKLHYDMGSKHYIKSKLDSTELKKMEKFADYKFCE